MRSYWEGDPQSTPHDRPFAKAFPRKVSDPSNHGAAWTPTQDKVLAAHIDNFVPMQDIARRLGRTERAIELRARHLGLEPALMFNPPKSKELTVNHMHLITLLQEGYTTVNVAFSEQTHSDYTYKVPKDAGYAVGDRVVVYGGSDLKVARVTEVHDEPQVDFTKPYALKWVVQKLDLAAYDDQVAREVAALDHLNKVKRKKDQEQMLETLFGGTEGLDELKFILSGVKGLK